jgi:hypothetical protein
MKDSDWELIIKVHVTGSYKVGFTLLFGGLTASGKVSMLMRITVRESCMAYHEEAEVRKNY